jgi:hypothetical protein
MSKQQTMPCFACGVATTLVRVPRRYQDGRIRCAFHRREHRERIKATWIAAANRYSPYMNRGGMQLVETETPESNAA